MATGVKVDMYLDPEDVEGVISFALYERVPGVGWVFVTANSSTDLTEFQADLVAELSAEFAENDLP